MEMLTVFTPTYNRAELLVRGYEALKRQTCYDFLWLIVDDGSTDDTRYQVEKWKKETIEFKIEYVYKENGGLHTGYNTAIELLQTELAVCVDSDDFLADNAVETIITCWRSRNKYDVAGIVALDQDLCGNIIGDPFPVVETINLIDLLIGKYRINNGDRKIVVRSDLYKMVAPQKGFEGEKYFNPHYMHLQISKYFDFLVLNEPLVYVDYQTDGMASNIFYQYYNSPRSFAEMRRLYLSFSHANILFRYRQCIHYVASSILSKDFLCFKKISCKFLALCAIPFSLLLLGIILIKVYSRGRR